MLCRCGLLHGIGRGGEVMGEVPVHASCFATPLPPGPLLHPSLVLQWLPPNGSLLQRDRHRGIHWCEQRPAGHCVHERWRLAQPASLSIWAPFSQSCPTFPGVQPSMPFCACVCGPLPRSALAQPASLSFLCVCQLLADALQSVLPYHCRYSALFAICAFVCLLGTPAHFCSTLQSGSDALCTLDRRYMGTCNAGRSHLRVVG